MQHQQQQHFIHTQRGDASLGVKLITSLVRASDYRYCVCSSRRRPMEPTADRASTLHLLTPRLSRLRTMGYEVGRLNLESIQLLRPISSCDQAAYSI